MIHKVYHSIIYTSNVLGRTRSYALQTLPTECQRVASLIWWSWSPSNWISSWQVRTLRVSILVTNGGNVSHFWSRNLLSTQIQAEVNQIAILGKIIIMQKIHISCQKSPLSPYFSCQSSLIIITCYIFILNYQKQQTFATKILLW